MGKEDTSSDGDKTFTQAELDKIVDERLKRERAKYSDYDQLKAKAGKAEQLENEKKSSEDKLAETIKSLQDDLAGERKARLVAEVAQAKGLTAGQAKRLQGSTREELESDADDLLESFPGAKKQDGDGKDGKTSDKDSGKDDDGDSDKDDRRKDQNTGGRRPKEKLRPGTVTDSDDDDDDDDPEKVADKVYANRF